MSAEPCLLMQLQCNFTNGHVNKIIVFGHFKTKQAIYNKLIVTNMYTEIDKKLMFKFLERNYPVTRIKHNMRFRRAIQLDNGQTFILGEEGSHAQLKFQLLDTLRQVFNCDEVICKVVLDSFLPIK